MQLFELPRLRNFFLEDYTPLILVNRYYCSRRISCLHFHLYLLISWRWKCRVLPKICYWNIWSFIAKGHKHHRHFLRGSFILNVCLLLQRLSDPSKCLTSISLDLLLVDTRLTGLVHQHHQLCSLIILVRFILSVMLWRILFSRVQKRKWTEAV